MLRLLFAFCLTAILAVGPATEKSVQAAGKNADKRVKVQAFLEYNKLPAGGKCRVIMEVKIEDGWHINANPAVPKFLKATKFTVKSKLGTKLTNVKYPKYHVVEIAGAESARVYDGKIQISGVLETPASAAGNKEEIQLEIYYQACNDASCERPDTFKIKGKIGVAFSVSELKKTNTDYFK